MGWGCAMASKKLLKPLPQYTVVPECDVLPLIRLARWAASAGVVLAEIKTMQAIAPDFDKAIQTYLSDVTFPENCNPCDLVEQVLWLADWLLESYLKAEG